MKDTHDYWWNRVFTLSNGSYAEVPLPDPSANQGFTLSGIPIPASAQSPQLNDAGEIAFSIWDGTGTWFAALYSQATGTRLVRTADGAPVLGGTGFLGNSGEILLDGRRLFSGGVVEELHAPPDVEALGAVDAYDAASRQLVTLQPFSVGGGSAGNVFGAPPLRPKVTTSGFMKAGVIVRLPYPDFYPRRTNAAGAVAFQGGWKSGLYNQYFLWTRTGGLQSLGPFVPPGWLDFEVQQINDLGQIVVSARYADRYRLFVLSPVATTPAGSNIAVESGSTSLTFSSVTSAGTTNVTQIDAGSVGQVPGGFSISETMAYQVATTATFTGPVTIGFTVPDPLPEAEFNQLAILHNDNGNLVDITIGRDYSRSVIYGTTNSFSAFYLASKGVRVSALFDSTKAHKAGSTVPLKLQILGSGGANVSSATLPLRVRKLTRITGCSTAAVIDSGNANPYSTFRYDASIGGSGGYIFNLSTKGLAPGRYSLSFYLGSDRRFVYSVAFEVR